MLHNNKPWEADNLDDEQRSAIAAEHADVLLDLLHSKAWGIISDHLESHIERLRDALEIDSKDDELHRGMLLAMRGTLSLPESRVQLARDFIERREDNE